MSHTFHPVSLYPLGTRVLLKNTKDPEFRGKIGVVTRYVKRRNEYVVTLEDGRQISVQSGVLTDPPPLRDARVQELESLTMMLLSMLHDLDKGYPWKELASDLDTVTATAGALGLPVHELNSDENASGDAA